MKLTRAIAVRKTKNRTSRFDSGRVALGTLLIAIFIVPFLLLVFYTNTFSPPIPKVPEAQAALPSYWASGTFTAGTGAITPPYPSIPANALCLLAVESENETISLTTANGFVQVPTWSPQSAGTAATDPASRLALYWKRPVGGDSAPVVADSGNHTTGQIHCFSGVITSGDPWDTGSGGESGGINSTSSTIFGATTAVADTLVVLITSTSFNGTSTAQCSGWTNADLANLLERTDNTHTAGLGGGHCMATGEKASAGFYATMAVTLANTSYKGTISLALKPPPPITTLADGTNPGPVTLAPGGAATMLDAFTFITDSGSDNVNDLTVTLAPAGAYDLISLAEITNDAGTATFYTSLANPTSNMLSFSGGTLISATTSLTQYKVRITPKSHAAMPVPPGVQLAITGTVTAFTPATNTSAGSDTASATITVDNASPVEVTGALATPANSQVTVSWTNPGDDFSNVVVYCKTATITEKPIEGSTPSVDGTPCDATARVKHNGSGISFTESGLTNGTTYYFRIFGKDTSGNYAATGVEVSATPAPASATWKATEDTAITGQAKLQNIRLRIQVKDVGLTTSYNYRLEWKTLGAGCSSGTYAAVPVTASAGDPFDMMTSTYFANGDPTTAKLNAPGGAFVAGKMVEDPSNSTGAFSLNDAQYSEFEFVFQATNDATAGGTYCFRVTNAGTPLDAYSVYPQVTIAP